MVLRRRIFFFSFLKEDYFPTLVCWSVIRFYLVAVLTVPFVNKEGIVWPKLFSLAGDCIDGDKYHFIKLMIRPFL